MPTTPPALEKTWIHNVNQVVTGSLSNAASHQMHIIKATLLAGGWEVVGSSSGAPDAAMDGVDRIGVWPSSWNWPIHASGTLTNGSWIVLRQPAIASDFQLMMFTANTEAPTGTMGYTAIAPNGGFTVYPTNPAYAPIGGTYVSCTMNFFDEGIVSFNSDSANPRSIIHTMYTTDKKNWRFIGYQMGVMKLLIMIDVVADAVTGWSPAFVATWLGGSTGPKGTYANYNALSTNCVSKVGVNTVNLYLTTESFGTGAVGTLMKANPETALFPIFPIGVACTDTGYRGRHGRLQDIYFTTTGGEVPDGSIFYGYGERFVKFGHFVLPWSSSLALPLVA